MVTQWYVPQYAEQSARELINWYVDTGSGAETEF